MCLWLQYHWQSPFGVSTAMLGHVFMALISLMKPVWCVHSHSWSFVYGSNITGEASLVCPQPCLVMCLTVLVFTDFFIFLNSDKQVFKTRLHIESA